MKSLILALLAVPLALHAQVVKRDIPYVENGHARHVLDIYAPEGAKSLPVVFWIHGGGWQTGDKSDVDTKPKWFLGKGFVFVSTNYRLLPEVDMGTLIRDCAKAYGWVQKNIAAHGGDPKRVLVGGHSAGAQLAAILCTDDRYLREAGAAFDTLIGCVPVDGDTYDIPAIIEVAETRNRVHGLPMPKFGHRLKFGNDPALHKDFSAVTHIAKGKSIPPFLTLYVSSHPDTTAQAIRLTEELKAAAVNARAFGAKNTNHSKLNNDLGLDGDPATKELDAFVTLVLNR
jgi:acetyl esterase/lipase